MKLERSIKIITVTFCLFLVASFGCREKNEQTGNDKIFRGFLLAWNIYPLDSIWQYYPEIESESPIVNNSDTGFQLVNTEFLEDEKGQPIKWDGIGWFRKRFDVPPDLLNKPVALRMGHFGASEIYLDGKLIHRYGIVAKNPKQEKIFVPRSPVIILLDSQPSHTFSVHYSNHHKKSPDPGSKFTGFRLLLAPADISLQPGYGEVPTLPITICVLIIFGFFFLFVYFFDRKRLASLLTSLLMFVYSLLFIGIYLSNRESETEGINLGNRLTIISSICTYGVQLLVLYALYYKGKLPVQSWLLVGIMIFFLFRLPSFFINWANPVTILIEIEIFRILILGLVRKKTGFWILLIGLIIQQAGFFILVQDVFNLFPLMTRTQEILLMIFPQMGIPLTYALHLAWEFGTANRDLRTQLAQVKTLSETTIRQEKEKQEILNQQKEKLESMVNERTKELSEQKETLEHTLVDLKATQTQLIQSEKMASLGELTAGIAHEIQNPLNFVNNFSEVNIELIQEAEARLPSLGGQGSGQKAGENSPEIAELLSDIKNNLEKISHHGKRADSIVKGMLQHSRTNSGEKEPTDINALAEEYLRLAYQGLRAKDKTFNTQLSTSFDPAIGKVNVVPQDIGRVLLNLYNNAFYAVHAKGRDNRSVVSTTNDYQPQVSVTTKRNGNHIEIAVKDNGNGIPKNIVDKIFQPFFTTKPTGQGTGLGLSLSYDIIKAHGGEIKVNSNEARPDDPRLNESVGQGVGQGQGSEFLITLNSGI